MKKTLTLLLIAVLSCVLFSSCNKYEESMYNKSKHLIQYVWYKSNVGDPNETFTYDKHHLLTDITILDTAHIGGVLAENYKFEYNKDKTVSKVFYTDGDLEETITFAYLNKYVKYMSYSINGEVRLLCNFYRDDEKAAKITRITEVYDHTFFEDMHLLSATSLYNRFIGNLQEMRDLSTSMNSKALTLYCNKTVTYQGENVVSLESEYPDLLKKVVVNFSYADVMNPYYGLNYAYSDELLGFSRNMPAEKTISTYYGGNLTESEIIAYDYKDVNKDKYPRMFTSASSKDAGIAFKTYIHYFSEYQD